MRARNRYASFTKTSTLILAGLLVPPIRYPMVPPFLFRSYIFLKKKENSDKPDISVSYYVSRENSGTSGTTSLVPPISGINVSLSYYRNSMVW